MARVYSFDSSFNYTDPADPQNNTQEHNGLTWIQLLSRISLFFAEYQAGSYTGLQIAVQPYFVDGSTTQTFPSLRFAEVGQTFNTPQEFLDGFISVLTALTSGQNPVFEFAQEAAGIPYIWDQVRAMNTAQRNLAFRDLWKNRSYRDVHAILHRGK